MGDDDGCRYVGSGVSLGWVMVAQRSLRRLFMLIIVGLVLPDCLVSCFLHFASCVFRFNKSSYVDKLTFLMLWDSNKDVTKTFL